jgi:raffinose/stachyose/melibiose transport system permease protein
VLKIKSTIVRQEHTSVPALLIMRALVLKKVKDHLQKKCLEDLADICLYIVEESMEKLLRNKKAILLFVLPALLIYLFSVFIPIVWSAIYSLFKGMPGISFDFVGPVNYLKMWSDKLFLTSFWVTLRYVLFVVAGQVGFGFLLSLMFAFAIKKYTTLVRTIVFFPVVLPVVAVGQLFNKLVEITPHHGLLNSLLNLLHLDFLIQPWLGQGVTALGVLCVMDIWTAMGFYAVIFYAALVNIPREILEAARIDGAKGFNLVRRIIIPQLYPIILTCLIFSLTGTLKVFESALSLTRGGPGIATKTLSMYMYDTSFLYSQYGYGSAIAVFILIECLLITLILQRLFAKVNKI